MDERQPYIKFVPASKCVSSSTLRMEDDGEEISKQYENIVTNLEPKPDKIAGELVKSRKFTKMGPPRNVQFKSEDIFKFCHYNNIVECRQWIQSGFDVNIRDFYGWTPLMAAACAGNDRIVSLLLESGADRNFCCKQGNTALELAKKFHKPKIVEILSNPTATVSSEAAVSTKRPSTSGPPTDAKRLSLIVEEGEEDAVSSNGFYQPPEPTILMCDLCGLVKALNMVEHQLSITHQLKTDRLHTNNRSLASYTHIDHNYKGYQLLRKGGWTGNSGLGKEEDGRRYPILPTPKPDRVGIGFPQQPEATTQSKSQRLVIAEAEKAKQFEIQFRREFY